MSQLAGRDSKDGGGCAAPAIVVKSLHLPRRTASELDTGQEIVARHMPERYDQFVRLWPG